MRDPEDIRRAVAKHFDIDVGTLKPGEERGPNSLSHPRQVLMYLLNHPEVGGMDLTEAGAFVGRDRTSAAFAVERCREKGKRKNAADAIRAKL